MVEMQGSMPHSEVFPAIVTASTLQTRAQEGHLFEASHEFNNIAGGDNADVLIQAPQADQMNIALYSFTPDVSGESVRIFEGTDFSDTGSQCDNVVNFNRVDGGPPSATITVEPTLNSTGTELSHEGVPNGGGGQQKNAAIEVSGVNWILNSDEDYLLRFTNETNNQADTVHFHMLWYRITEEELK